MSRAKKARARKQRHAAAPPQSPPGPKPRIEAAYRRVALAKAGVASAAIVGFGVALVLSRVSYAGHQKKPLRPLAAPPHYVQIVRENLLQAGIVAPAQAPPGAETASS